MYHGESTEELIRLREEYEKIFGYDPNGEMELEFKEEDYNLYIETLKECIKSGKDIFEMLDC